MPTSLAKTRPLTRALSAALCLAALAAIAVVDAASSAGAQDASALRAQIDDARAQADRLGAEIEANAAAIAEAGAQARAAAEREAELTAVLEQGTAKLEALEERVAATEVALARVHDRLRQARELLAERLIAIYKGGVPDATELILEADGFDDLTTRVTYLRKIERSDEVLAERVAELRDEVEAELAAGRQARDRQAEFNERLATARDQIAAARAAAESRAAELEALRRQQIASVDELRGKIGGWTEQVEEIERMSAADAQQEVAAWLGDYAIPTAIVICESGGNYDAVNPRSGAGGAYQIMPETWELYGGKGAPQDASPEQQDSIAAQIWADSGSAPWVCAN